MASDAAVGAHVLPGALGAYTVVVAACSIVYELIYSQALTLVYGQTVTRYALTIGLFLMSLGVGAFIFARRRRSVGVGTFYAVELALAVIGPAGVFIIVFLPADAGWSVWLSHAPVIVVGLLSGIELPLLASFASPHRRSIFEVLGWDYFGSLAGTVVYGMWLYPEHGLIAAAIGTGALNAFAAVSFAVVYGRRTWLALVAHAVVFAGSVAGVTYSGDLQAAVSRWYAEEHVRERFESLAGALEDVEIKHVQTTRYQEIWRYDLHWSFGTDRCLDLDGLLQMCESWINEYHHALIDVPVAHFPPEHPLDVLLIGGGDFISTAFLLRHANVAHLDQVDIDEEFMAYAKRSDLLSAHHQGAYTNPRLRLHVADGFSFVGETERRYDLIVLDLPGLEHDKLLPLYSVEFFRRLRGRLKDDGLVGTWVYAEIHQPIHAQVLRHTWAAAGFEHLARYRSFTDGTGSRLNAEYALLSAAATPAIRFGHVPYVDRWRIRYEQLEWEALVELESRGNSSALFSVNSVFRPNPALLVRRR